MTDGSHKVDGLYVIHPVQRQNPTRVEGVKPFLKWAGGKGELLPELLNRLPNTYERYYEPFLGGGALFFEMQPKLPLLNDFNVDVTDTYFAVQVFPELLIEDLQRRALEFKQAENLKDFYLKLRSLENPNALDGLSLIERASRFIAMNKTGYNGLSRYNKKGLFNAPPGSYKNPTICNAQLIQKCSEVLHNAVLLNLDFEEFLIHSKYAPRSGDFVYLDPPYVPVSKTANFAGYTNNSFKVEDHKRLAEVCQILHQRGVQFMLSNSNHPTVFELWSDFKIETVMASRRINRNASGRSPVQETIIRNYEGGV